MEHKLITGGEQWLPFARSRIKALRATGLQYVTQKYEIEGSNIEVRIVGEHEYINIADKGLYAHLLFWKPPPGGSGLNLVTSETPAIIGRPKGEWYTVRIAVPTLSIGEAKKLSLSPKTSYNIVGFYDFDPVMTESAKTSTYSVSGNRPNFPAPNDLGGREEVDVPGRCTKTSTNSSTYKLMHGKKEIVSGSYTETDVSEKSTWAKYVRINENSPWIGPGMYEGTDFKVGTFSIEPYTYSQSFNATLTDYLTIETRLTPDGINFYSPFHGVASIRGNMLAFVTMSGAVSGFTATVDQDGHLVYPPGAAAALIHNKKLLSPPKHVASSKLIKLDKTLEWTGRANTDAPFAIVQNRKLTIPDKDNPELDRYTLNCPWFALRMDVGAHIPNTHTGSYKVQSVCRENVYLWGDEGYAGNLYETFETLRYMKVNFITGKVDVVRLPELQVDRGEPEIDGAPPSPVRRFIYFDDYVVAAEGDPASPNFSVILFESASGKTLAHITDVSGSVPEEVRKVKVKELPEGCYFVNIFRDEACVI